MKPDAVFMFINKPHVLYLEDENSHNRRDANKEYYNRLIEETYLKNIDTNPETQMTDIYTMSKSETDSNESLENINIPEDNNNSQVKLNDTPVKIINASDINPAYNIKNDNVTKQLENKELENEGEMNDIDIDIDIMNKLEELEININDHRNVNIQEILLILIKSIRLTNDKINLLYNQISGLNDEDI
jgi:hypothetical protein